MKTALNDAGQMARMHDMSGKLFWSTSGEVNTRQPWAGRAKARAGGTTAPPSPQHHGLAFEPSRLGDTKTRCRQKPWRLIGPKLGPLLSWSKPQASDLPLWGQLRLPSFKRSASHRELCHICCPRFLLRRASCGCEYSRMHT